jgi:hypothetical protein
MPAPCSQSDQFLSEEDLDLKNLTWEELLLVWDAWLQQASITDEQDARLYSHGVFSIEPETRSDSAPALRAGKENSLPLK